jgi:TadE-like protein
LNRRTSTITRFNREVEPVPRSRRARPSPPPRPRHRRGQSLVEFALILPLLLVLTAGVVDLARVFSAYIALTDGVREGALYAAQGTNNTKWCAPADPDSVACPPGSDPAVNESADPENIAYQIKSTGLDVSEISMRTPVCAPSPCADGSTVTIAASYRMSLVTPVLGDILGGDVSVSASTTAEVLP